ncbi:MAG: EAL domain-containing protein [Bacteroides sp.]|nr:EAL domain-containing protein [Bacteroides sp.]MCM1551001.1 EAL domain-containing protein [Clostridium sp.]
MNIKMQCCGLILLAVIFFFYHRQKKINLNTEKAFLRIFMVVTLGLTLDMLSIVALFYIDDLPTLLVDIICKAYLSSLVLVAVNGVLYVLADIYAQSRQYKRRVYIYSGIAGVGILLICMLPVYKNLENPGNAYTYGPGVLTTYLICLSFFGIMTFLSFKMKARMNPKRWEAVLTWIVLWLASAIVQFFNNHILLVGYAGAIGIMIIYLKLENPETNLDRQTGLFNQNALLQYMKQQFGMGEDFALLIMSFPASLIHSNPEEAEIIRMEIIQYVASLPDTIAFKGSEEDILLVFQNQEQAETVEAQLDDRFDEGWGRSKSIVLHPEWMLIPSVSDVHQAEDILPYLQYAKENSMDFAESGRVLLDQDMTNRMYEERLIEQLLADAIQNDWIEVYYQPIYSIKEKQFVSAEALIRIIEEDGTIVSPEVFIDIAEKNGMILKLGEIVFKKVCQFISQNHPDELGIHYIEINLSVVQCSYEHLADSFIEIMEWYHINPSMINLEITESGSVGTTKTLLENMNKLIAYGVKFSLDDFGTGHSNLNYIVDMPVDIVKFDRSMIVSYFDNGKAKYVMDAAMHMIHGMELQIVSEGIETKEQLDTMEQLGISYIQGYYFSKPVSSDAFLSFLEENNEDEVILAED